MSGQWYGSFLGSKCVFLIDTTRPPELETNLVIDSLFFYFLSILKKYRNAVWILIKMSYGKDDFLDWDDEGLDLGT